MTNCPNCGTLLIAWGAYTRKGDGGAVSYKRCMVCLETFAEGDGHVTNGPGRPGVVKFCERETKKTRRA